MASASTVSLNLARISSVLRFSRMYTRKNYGTERPDRAPSSGGFSYLFFLPALVLLLKAGLPPP